MKFLKTLNKFIEGIMWLYLPLVLFYWALMPVQFSFAMPIKGLLGKIIEPMLLFVNGFFDFSFLYKGQNISYAPLVLCGAVLSVIIIAFINEKILNLIENLISKVNINIATQNKLKKRKKETMEAQEELEKNKTIYVMLKIVKIKQHEEYLIKNDDGPFSVGLVDSYQLSILNMAKKFTGKEYQNFKAGDDTYNFVFTDIEKFLQYLKFLKQKIKEINKGTAELNTIFEAEIACGCSYSIATIDSDLAFIHKILKLCGKGEILITDILKDRIELFNPNFKIKLEPKGLYMLNDKQVDIHKMQYLQEI